MEEKKKLYLKNACVYVSLYIKSFSEICPSLINDFNTIGGFSILNNIFIYDSDDKSSAECYKILLENSEMNKIVFEKLYDLYQNEETNSNIRTSIISFILKLFFFGGSTVSLLRIEASSPANTAHSKRELLASLFAPWSPVEAHSPIAYRFLIVVFELISILSELNKRRTDSECPLDAARCNAVSSLKFF